LKKDDYDAVSQSGNLPARLTAAKLLTRLIGRGNHGIDVLPLINTSTSRNYHPEYMNQCLRGGLMFSQVIQEATSKSGISTRKIPQVPIIYQRVGHRPH
jgi:hypothetical protein